MSAEDYIQRYGSALSDAEKRYILAFGPPQGFHEGPARNPSTPGLQVTAYETAPEALQEAEERARAHAEEEDAAEWGAL